MQNVPPAEPLAVEDHPARTVKPDQEYWKPILPRREESSGQYVAANAGPVRCPDCKTEFVVGARFCHFCGGSRPSTASELASAKMLQGLSAGLSTAGVLFGGIAASLSWIYSPSGYENWQAVQNWRTQWLLAAAVAFLACLCLKTKSR